MKIDKEFIKRLLDDYDHVSKTLKEDDFAEIIQYANYYYYNTDKPVMPDNIYDLIKEKLEDINPNHPILNHVGAVVDDDERKSKLPYWMGSMDKIKSDETIINKWKANHNKGQIIISDKLDGNSAMIYWKNHQAYLYTRGNGKEGQNISHLIPFIHGIPTLSKFAKYKELCVRGEIIISKEDFKSVSDLGANGRNMVAGVLNAKKPNLQILKLTQFIAYELVMPRSIPSSQFELLNKLGFKTVYHMMMNIEDMNTTSLSNTLTDRRNKSEFEIDGIIVFYDDHYDILTKGNPKYAFAFKSMVMMDKAEVIVTGVEWNISKDGYIKPVVLIQPVQLTGVQVKRVTGFNAKYIKDNKIGPGAKIVVTRSGDVIPHITDIIQPADTPALPTNINYKWNETKIDIIVDDEDNKETKFKQIEYFFSKINTTGVSKGILRKLFDNGYDNIGKILKLKSQDLEKIDGFKGKLAEKICLTITNTINNTKTLTLMSASNQFGRGIGEKKLEIVANKYPEVLSSKKPKLVVEELVILEGIEMKTALQIIKGLDAWHEFAKENDIFQYIKETTSKASTSTTTTTTTPTNHIFQGRNFLFTGVRSKEVEEYIVGHGGVIKSSISKNIHTLICKDPNATSSKLQEARKLGIEIMSITEFVNTYMK